MSNKKNTSTHILSSNEWALVVEGGAMRGIFSTGVLDSFLSNEFNPFSLCIGVSAGATNLASYLAKMPKRNYEIYTTYSRSKDFISFARFLKGGHYMDLDWLWTETITHMRLNLKQIDNGPSRFLVGLTNIKTGKAEFLEPTEDNLETIIKASSALPLVYRTPIAIDGVDYADGGISAPIPVDQAIALGYKNIVILRSRPTTFLMKKKLQWIERMTLRSTPRLLDAITHRYETYNKSIHHYRNSKNGLNIIEIAPDESFSTSRFTKDMTILNKDYQMGLTAGLKLMNDFDSYQNK